MNSLRKTTLISVLLLIGVADISIYWNYHLYYQARKSDDPEKKIALLERSNRILPWNYLAFYELGKAYFDLGIGQLSDLSASESHLRESVARFEKSLSINPASPFAHFHLAQSLLNLELVSSEKDTRSYTEFRKAALLAGEDSQVFNEVGRISLARWPRLSDQEKSLTLEMLKKILAKKDSDKISLILNTWELNAKDYQIIESILPEDAQVYRQYAQFLGEKSLSIERRHAYLARAELLDFRAALAEFESGALDLSRSRVHGASSRFTRALNLLREISFYPAPAGEPSVPGRDFLELMKSVYLNLAKCRVEEGDGLNEVVNYLRQYLNLEDQATNIGALESYLRNRRVIPPQFDRNPGDLDRLGFELLLLSKQKRHDDIVASAPGLDRSFLMVPKAKRRSYAASLQIVGQSYHQTDSLPAAEDFYRRALQVNPANVEALLGLRQVCNRLNDEKKLTEVDLEITRALSPRVVEFKGVQLRKGQVHRMPLALEGQDIVLDIHYQVSEDGREPLLSVLFNDRTIWDDYSPGGTVSVTVNTKIGGNILQITPVNGPISLLSLTYRTADENKNR